MTKGKGARPPMASGARTRRAPPPRRISTKLIAIVVVAVLVVVGGVVLLNAMQSPSSVPPVAGLITESGAKGSPDAKVTITEFSDFQCPYCKDFALTTGRQIDQAYVKTNKVRFVYRNRAVIGPESNWAGEAAYCAGEQGKFWEYHDKLFSSQAGENQGALAKANLKRFATELGLDGSAFNACLDSGKYTAQVRSETADSEKRGVTGTPSFFINNVKVVGAQPFESFKASIEAELRRAQ